MQDRILNKIEQEIFDKTKPIVSNNGYSLVDVVLANQDGQRHLSLFVYRSQNMSVEDIAAVSGSLDAALDTLECLSDGYILEVSSPGINRIIKSRREFEIFNGLQMKILTDDGSKYIGKCAGTNGDEITLTNIENSDKDIIININNITKAKLFG